MITVSYIGFLGIVVRQFETMERAQQWARQCGIFDKCKFTIGA